MKKVDLSSLGWKYTEIRGKVFQAICGIKLTMVDQKSAKQLDLNRLKKFDNVRPIGSDLSSLFIPITRSLEESELKSIFPNFTSDMLIDGEISEFEPNIDMPKISLGPNGVREEDALGAHDCLTGKASSELGDEELLKLIERRTVPLSKLRVLHDMLDDKEIFGETAMFWLFQRLRNFFNATPICVESAIWSFDGKSYNPPIRVVRDEHLSSFSRYKQPLFYKRGAAYEPTEPAEATQIESSSLKVMKSSVASREKASSEIFKMSETPSPASRRSLDLMNVPDSSLAAQDGIRKEIHGEAMDTNFPEAKPASKPLIEEHAFCVDEQIGPAVEKEDFIEALEQDRLPSIHSFLDGKSVMKVAFSKIAKNLTSWYDEFSKLNPYINRDIFFASARLYILERSAVSSATHERAQPAALERQNIPSTNQTPRGRSLPNADNHAETLKKAPTPQSTAGNVVPSKGIKVASISRRVGAPNPASSIAPTSVARPVATAPRVTTTPSHVDNSTSSMSGLNTAPKRESMLSRLKSSSNNDIDDDEDFGGVAARVARAESQQVSTPSIKPGQRAFRPPKAVASPK